jgi:hypothetical protein
MRTKKTKNYKKLFQNTNILKTARNYDNSTIEILKIANYWGGITTVQGATQQSDDLFELHRVRIRGTTTPDDLARLLSLDW